MEPVALRRTTKLVAASTFLLLIAGGLVTSTGSGLAVPDWPLSFGRWMPAMQGGVRYEHGHRIVAGVVGLLIAAQAVWLWRADPRPHVRALGWLAVAAVALQALLGGMTVLLRLPDPVSVSHAALAEIVFGLTVAIALATSRSWWAGPAPAVDPHAPSLATLASLTTLLVFAQIVLGAVVRHTGAGLAIPDVPLAYGQLVPPLDSRPVVLHFAHRLGAIVVAAAAGWTVARVARAHASEPRLARPAWLLAALVALQILLGGWTVLSAKAAGVATAHLGGGALLLATSVVLAMRARRHLRPGPEPAGAPLRPLIEPVPL